MAQIKIEEKVYPSKKAVVQHIRDHILYSEPPEKPIKGANRSFLLSLLERHPEHDRKVGCGVGDVFVRVNTQYGKNKGFWLRREDGTETDWSFYECLSPKPPRHDFDAAAREAVRDQIEAFKALAFRDSPILPCPITGEVVTASTCHVDHVAPATFKRLLDDFIEADGVAVASVPIDGFDDGQVVKRLADEGLKARWADYHRRHANLRILSATANLSHAKKKT